MPGGSLLASLRRLAGWDEVRCACCLDPYVPGTTRAQSPGLCPDCFAAMPRRTMGYCPLCGEIAALASAPPVPCGVCLSQRPPWSEFRFYGEFSGLLRDMLHRGKYHGDAACLEALGNLLTLACTGMPCPDALVPMPLHPQRLRQRGYNQCREMARPLSRILDAPTRAELLLRTRHTFPQTGLTREERKANLSKAFTAAPQARGLRLLLIDDTATTGTSLKLATHALLRAGAARVDVAVVAHASLHHAPDALP